MMDVKEEAKTLAPLFRSVEVALSPAEAFDLFANRMSKWWPLASHSVAGEDAVEVVLEPWVGGRIYERDGQGAECDWGRIVACETGRRLMFTWHPGRDEETSQEVELRFVPTRRGTRVELEHRNWEVLGNKAEDIRKNYADGWELVLCRRYRDFCSEEVRP